MNKKDYKGYELIKAISDKEIKDKTKVEVHSLRVADNIIAVIEYSNKRLEWGTGEFDTSYLFDNYIYFRVLEDNTEEIEELNAYKLMESPYMANLLKEQRYDKFMELLKQSEVEIADKLIKLTWVVKEMRKEITNVNKNNIH